MEDDRNRRKITKKSYVLDEDSNSFRWVKHEVVCGEPLSIHESPPPGVENTTKEKPPKSGIQSGLRWHRGNNNAGLTVKDD